MTLICCFDESSVSYEYKSQVGLSSNICVIIFTVGKFWREIVNEKYDSDEVAIRARSCHLEEHNHYSLYFFWDYIFHKKQYSFKIRIKIKKTIFIKNYD